jgi:hypothetical protein
MAKYFAFGDYGFDSEYELADFGSIDEGRRWLKRYTRGGDLGGYSVIEVASFADDGEYIVHESVRLEED